MIQQINLYQECLKEKKDPFPPSTMGVALATGLFALLVLFGISQWQAGSLDERYHYLQNRKAEILEALKKVEDHAEPTTGNTLLQEELTRIKAVVGDKSVLLKKMAGLKDRSQHGFSRYLETLGRSGLEGLWLTRIEVREAGRDVVLEGMALHPWQVSLFTEKLARQEGFTGLTAARILIQNTEKDGDRVSFLLETAPEKSP